MNICFSKCYDRSADHRLGTSTSREFHTSFPFDLMYADDIMICQSMERGTNLDLPGEICESLLWRLLDPRYKCKSRSAQPFVQNSSFTDVTFLVILY